jgi:hypothetical protein
MFVGVRSLIPAFCFVASLVAPIAAARATIITFEAIDLTDVVPGENLYRYVYSLDAFPYDAGYGFSIYFPFFLHTALESPPPAVSADWDVLSLQPDWGLPADGIYDALALVSEPATLSGFTIDFVWLGSGAPSSQFFLVYDSAFNPVESGQTFPVPESGTFCLLSIGLVLLRSAAACRR